MNWFKGMNPNDYRMQYDPDLSRGDLCPHVEADPKCAYYARCEFDSFGIVGASVACKDCDKKDEEEAGKLTVICADCGEPKPMNQCHEWRWYDFYAPQGDEPRIVCKKCWELPRHKERMKKDAEDADWEHRRYLNGGKDPGDDDGYYDDSQDY